MSAKIFNGKYYSKKRQVRIEKEVKKLRAGGVTPTLASIYLTTDAGSQIYTKLKKRVAESVGVKFIPIKVERKNSVEKIIANIEKLNAEDSVQGIIVQKPSGKNDFLPKDWSKIVMSLAPYKDIDGLTPENLGLLIVGKPRFIPATVKAVLQVLKEGKIEVSGKHVVIIGASGILGKPLSMLLTDKDATMSVLHKATTNLVDYTKVADIIVSATGVPGIISADIVKDDVAVIDVGSPRGDVQFDQVSKKASFITPVPGGIGPVTISSLLENLVEAARSGLH